MKYELISFITLDNKEKIYIYTILSEYPGEISETDLEFIESAKLNNTKHLPSSKGTQNWKEIVNHFGALT